MLKKGIYLLAALFAVALVPWGLDYWESRQYVVVVISPAPLYSLNPAEYPASNPLTTTLSPGMAIRVLRVRYGKDFEALQIETSGKQTGWVISGEGVKVLSRSRGS
jgi:hypothetical protein